MHTVSDGSNNMYLKDFDLLNKYIRSIREYSKVCVANLWCKSTKSPIKQINGKIFI